MEYMIMPVKMGGLIKEVYADSIKVHLHGRLGVINVSKDIVDKDVPLEAGQEVQFYFSYIQVTSEAFDHDCSSLVIYHESAPCLVGGLITEVNDTAIKADIMNNIGTVAVPRRWVFTPVPLETGQRVEFYFSCLEKAEKKD